MNNKSLTLLDNIERVVSAAKMYKFNEMFFSLTQEPLQELSARFGITPKQALIFALMLEYGHHRKIYMSNIVSMMECNYVCTLSFMNEADVLCQRGLLVCVKNRDTTYYVIPIDVINAIRENRVYEPIQIADLNEAEFYHTMDKIFMRAHSNEHALKQALIDLVKANKHIPFVQALFKYGIMDNCENTWDVLMACVYANRLITFDDDIIGKHNWENYFQESINIKTIDFGLKNGMLKLCRCNLVELTKYKGIEEDYYYHFTNRAKRELFPNHPYLIPNKYYNNKRERHNQVK